jgi:hypothetical protein
MVDGEAVRRVLDEDWLVHLSAGRREERQPDDERTNKERKALKGY